MSRKQKPRSQKPPRQPNAQNSQVAARRTEISHHSGPIPSPEDLERYRAISPDLVDRIVTMAEQEAEHRRQIDERTNAANIKISGWIAKEHKRGQVFAFGIGTLALTVTGWCAYVGAQWAASVLGGGTLIALVTAFLKGRRQ